MSKFSLPFCDATEIFNMATCGLANMAAVANIKIILRGLQNSLVLFTFKVGVENTLAAF